MNYVRSSSLVAALALGSLAASGCVTVTEVPPFDPFGSQVSASGEWDVDGAAPTALSCGDITTVRALVCETSAGTNCLATGDLTFDCIDGAFDTRPGAILLEGTYYIVWEALNVSGVRLQASSPTRLDAFGSHVIFPRPDFAPGASVFDPSGSAVSLDGIWDVNGDVPSAYTCGDIATVRVVICEDDLAFSCWTSASLTFDCEDGEFDTRPAGVLAAGSYYSYWEALDSGGNVLQDTNLLPLVVTSIAHATLATPDFDGVTPTTVTIEANFQEFEGSGNYDACDGAGIGIPSFTYTLHEGTEFTDPIIVGETTQLCAAGRDILFSDNAGYQFDTGSYTIFVSASETVNNCTSLWDAKCTFTLTLGAENVVQNCNATVVSSGPGCL